MKSIRFLRIIFSLCFGLFCQIHTAQNKSAIIKENNQLVISNAKVKFTYLFNDGALALQSITDLENNSELLLVKPISDFYLIDESTETSDVQFKIQPRSKENNYAEAEIIYRQDLLWVKRILRLYDEASMVKTTYFLKGQSSAVKWESVVESDNELIESQHETVQQKSHLAQLQLNFKHAKFKSVAFNDATDHNDNLVIENEFMAFGEAKHIAANMLFVEFPEANQSISILKEAPLGFSQQAYPGFDFTISNSQISLHGLGITPQDLHTDAWVRGYGYAIGLGSNITSQLHLNLLQYQKQDTFNRLDNKAFISSNTWGDRSKDGRMNEAFILQEIEKAKTLGITDLQLDDGWQQGLSKNSFSEAGSIWDDWQKDDWQPHQERFPNGFQHIVDKAKVSGIKLGLWFNPTKTDDYINWKRDAEILIDYYNIYGFTNFKIDGVALGSKLAEIRFRKLLDYVKEKTKHNAVFNLDVTAGNRGGYFYFTEYGTIFLENRYTDWGNYYAYRTLRNLWHLAAYVPSENFQIEFLNVNRNQHKYKKQQFAPVTAGLDYSFAVTMAAQPLAWMELSGLETISQDFVEIISDYKKIAPDLNKAVKLPIGEAPDGRSFTGFLAVNDMASNYLIVYRESTENASYDFELPTNINSVKQLFGDVTAFELLSKNTIKITFKASWDFAVFKVD